MLNNITKVTKHDVSFFGGSEKYVVCNLTLWSDKKNKEKNIHMLWTKFGDSSDFQWSNY